MARQKGCNIQWRNAAFSSTSLSDSKIYEGRMGSMRGMTRNLLHAICMLDSPDCNCPRASCLKGRHDAIIFTPRVLTDRMYLIHSIFFFLTYFFDQSVPKTIQSCLGASPHSLVFEIVQQLTHRQVQRPYRDTKAQASSPNENIRLSSLFSGLGSFLVR